MSDLASRITTALFERNVNPHGGPPLLLGGDLADPDHNGIEAVIREFLNAAPQGESGPESPDKGAEPVDVGQVGTTRPLSAGSPAAPAPAEIVAKIVTDIASRSMIGLAWEQIPEERRREIAAGWLEFFPRTMMTDEDVMLSQLGRIRDLEEVLADKRRLTRELDVALSGPEGAAQQASLCDLIPIAKKMREELARLEKLVYVPGLWRCAKCKLTMVSQTLYVKHGEIGPNTKPQECPNGCGPLWRVTERDAGNELADKTTAAHNNALELAAKICERWGGAEPARVPGFIAQIAEDVRAANDAADLVGRGPAARELAKAIRDMKGPE